MGLAWISRYAGKLFDRSPCDALDFKRVEVGHLRQRSKRAEGLRLILVLKAEIDPICFLGRFISIGHDDARYAPVRQTFDPLSREQCPSHFAGQNGIEERGLDHAGPFDLPDVGRDSQAGGKLRCPNKTSAERLRILWRKSRAALNKSRSFRLEGAAVLGIVRGLDVGDGS